MAFMKERRLNQKVKAGTGSDLWLKMAMSAYLTKPQALLITCHDADGATEDALCSALCSHPGCFRAVLHAHRQKQSKCAFTLLSNLLDTICCYLQNVFSGHCGQHQELTAGLVLKPCIRHTTFKNSKRCSSCEHDWSCCTFGRLHKFFATFGM